jgi:hypothetical protein
MLFAFRMRKQRRTRAPFGVSTASSSTFLGHSGPWLTSMAFQSAPQAGQPCNSVCAEYSHFRRRKTWPGRSFSCLQSDRPDAAWTVLGRPAPGHAQCRVTVLSWPGRSSPGLLHAWVVGVVVRVPPAQYREVFRGLEDPCDGHTGLRGIVESGGRAETPTSGMRNRQAPGHWWNRHSKRSPPAGRHCR